jgi:hypothetical protein
MYGTATVRCSYNCIDTALGEFFHLDCGFQVEKYFLIIKNECESWSPKNRHEYN